MLDGVLLAISVATSSPPATALYTGIRIFELLGLIWRDADFDAGSIRGRAQGVSQLVVNCDSHDRRTVRAVVHTEAR
jgi:integrase